jgi:hypothetical protein
MRRHPCNTHARFDDGVMYALAVHPRAAERGKQRRVNVDDSSLVLRDDVCGNQAHISGEDDQVYIVFRQQLAERWLLGVLRRRVR